MKSCTYCDAGALYHDRQNGAYLCQAHARLEVTGPRGKPPRPPLTIRPATPADRPRNACIFAPRCDYATEKCREERPAMVEISLEHAARCLYALEIEQRPKTNKRRAKPARVRWNRHTEP